MNILIDFSQIPIKKTGVGTYAVNLIQKFSETDTEDRFFILIQDDERVFDHLHDHRFLFITVSHKFFRRILPRFLLEQLFIPWLIRKHHIDCVHSLHYSFPLFTFTAKKVVTVHDMTFFLFPEYHLVVKRYYFRFWIHMAAEFADRIITDSRSTRDDFYLLTRERKLNVTVVPLACSMPEIPDSHKEDFRRIQKKYNLQNDYFLFIGTIEPRKNIIRLIHAFEKLSMELPVYTLVIIGQKGWDYEKVGSVVEKSDVKNRIVFAGFVEEIEKLLLLKYAKLFLYPSIYEGFGLPVLEALSHGIPTVTSNVSSMPEIAGDAALKVNPLDVDEIYSAMKSLLEDESVYRSFQQKARDQARLFSWEKTAGETLQVYHSNRSAENQHGQALI
jgi:glycosyltransferase involved in cell wall biosynthesis